MTLVCALCKIDIVEGQVYFHTTLEAQDAAELLDVEHPDQLLIWEQMTDGRVLLRYCSRCAEEINVFDEMTAAKA